MATTLSRPTNTTSPRPVLCPPHFGQAVAQRGWLGLTTSTGRCPGWAGRQPCGGCRAAPPAVRCPAAAAPRRQRPLPQPCLRPPALQVPTACRRHQTPLHRVGRERGREGAGRLTQQQLEPCQRQQQREQRHWRQQASSNESRSIGGHRPAAADHHQQQQQQRAAP